MKKILVLTWTVSVISCERASVREYNAPKEVFAEKTAGGEQVLRTPNLAENSSLLNLKIPPDWQRQSPTPMRKAGFVVEGEDGAKVDISIASFQGESGGLLANVNRWREQLGLNAVSAEELEATIERRFFSGRDFAIVDIVNEQPAPNAKQRIIGAVTLVSGETWFFKMTGDEALTAAQKPAFLQVLESAEFGHK